MFNITCPKCNAQLRVKELNRERTCRCPKCQNFWRVDNADEGESEKTYALAEPLAPPRAIPISLTPRKRTEKSSSSDCLDERGSTHDDEQINDTQNRKLVLPILAGIAVLLVATTVGLVVLLRPKADTANTDGPAFAANTTGNDPNDLSVKSPVEQKPNLNSPANLPPLGSGSPIALSGEVIYSKLLKGTAIVETESSIGSAGLVHADRKWLITNQHVVANSKIVRVHFPAFNNKGEVITDPDYYFKKNSRRVISGTVVHLDPRRDLAIIQLNQLPDGVAALPLASKPANVGETVYSLGGSGISTTIARDKGTMWRQSSGPVRSRFKDTIKFGKGENVSAMFLESQKPTNPGDSGGATVNSRGAIVAVVQSVSKVQSAVTNDIDLVEIRDFLTRSAKASGWEWNLPALDSTSPGPSAQIESALSDLSSDQPTKVIRAAQTIALYGPDARRAQPALLKALIKAAPEHRQALFTCLEALGPLDPNDEPIVVEMVRSADASLRKIACRYYAKLAQPSTAALEPLLGDLAGKDRELRAAALHVFIRYGPSCKNMALRNLIDVLGDDDEEVASTALGFLNTFNYEESDRDLLIKVLEDAKTKISCRRFAARNLPAIWSDVSSAGKYWPLRMEDSDDSIRTIAVEQVGRWPDCVKANQYDLIKIAKGDTVAAVRVASLKALMSTYDPREYFEQLLAIATADSDPGVRAVSGEFLSRLELKSMTFNDLRELGKRPIPALQVRLVERYAELGSESAPAMEDVLKYLNENNDSLRLATVKFVGKLEKKAETAVPRLLELFSKTGADSPSESVKVETATALPKMGLAGQKAVVSLVERPHPEKVRNAVISAVGYCGEHAKSTVPQLLKFMADSAHADSCGESLARLGTDHIIEELIKRIYVGNFQRPEIGEVRYSATERCAALKSFGKFDFKKMSEATFKRIKSAVEVVTVSKNADAESKKQAADTLNIMRLAQQK